MGKMASVGFKPAMTMIWGYIKSKLLEQVKAVAFIILYLIGFKMIALQSFPENPWQIALGVLLVIIGLALFLEGLMLGLMPLGDKVGIRLPQKTNILVIMIFGLLLGFGATLAEPAISTLRQAGENVTPWETPLLYRFLEIETDSLVNAVGAGVGVAVACGMARFYYGFGLKWFIYILTPVLLIMSGWFATDENLKYIINLAWDTGGVTTGPVTVPLVLAMGIGISRAGSKNKGAAASGYGVVTLASLFPVLGVFVLGLMMNPSTPSPVTQEKFFSPEYRQEALKMMKTENALEALAFQRGSSEGRKIYYGDATVEIKTYSGKIITITKYEKAVASLVREEGANLLGNLSLKDWLSRRASEEEKNLVAMAKARLNSAQHLSAPAVEEDDDEDDEGDAENDNSIEVLPLLKNESYAAIFAVVPLVLLLLVVLVFVLRDRLKNPDEVILGIAFSLVGMAILTTGIRLGLSSLGDQIGRPLPQIYKNEAQEAGRVVIRHFNMDNVFTAYSETTGKAGKYFYMTNGSGNVRAVPFEEDRYNSSLKTYEHIETKEALAVSKLTLVGIALVCLFAFGMGYGSTVAEPALNALGITVEEKTVGMVKRSNVVGTVSLGVGIGLLVGILRIIVGLSTCWLLIPGYIILMILTYYCDEEFTGLAWDSGGVTTGPITVPLVLAMGLGIGGGLNIVDGFGIVSMASLFPIITMLIFGIRVKNIQSKLLNTTTVEEVKNEL